MDTKDKDFFLTTMQIYVKLVDIKDNYDLQEYVEDFPVYVDKNSDILVKENESFNEALEMLLDDEKDRYSDEV